MDSNLTPGSKSARDLDPRRLNDSITQAQNELRRHVTDIVTRTQSLLIEPKDREVAPPEWRATAQTIQKLAEQSLELINQRLTSALSGSVVQPKGNAGVAKLDLALGKATMPKPELLVVDDNAVNRELLARRLELQGYRVSRSENGRQALEQLRQASYDLVLLDIMMPEVDGYEVLKQMKADEALRHIPVIMISALGDLDSIVRCIEVGAEDYLPKPFNSTLLVARVEACLEKKQLRDQEQRTYQALVQSQSQLASELAEAADYVRSLLPAPIDGPIKTDWKFIPSTQLGGDSFGYHWLDNDHFVLYLLDVCGHGVGAALLSSSVVNVLRSQALPDADFRNPSQVLQGLNESFPMEKQNNMYFTIWYGVFSKSKRELSYAIGGHPHAVLLSGADEASAKLVPSGAPGLLIGGMPGIQYKTHTTSLGKFAKLILYSDGVFEVMNPAGQMWDTNDFLQVLLQLPTSQESELDRVFASAKQVSQTDTFEDDFSMVKFIFQEEALSKTKS